MYVQYLYLKVHATDHSLNWKTHETMLQRNPAILILLQGKKLLSKTNNVYLPAISKQSGKISYMWNNANKIVPHN